MKKEFERVYVVDIMNHLHEKGLYKVEGLLSIGLDTGFRMSDIQRLEREDIVEGKITDFYCNKYGRSYPEVKLSNKSLELLNYLPKTGKLFPKPIYIYISEVRENAEEKFSWHQLRKIKLGERQCE